MIYLLIGDEGNNSSDNLLELYFSDQILLSTSSANNNEEKTGVTATLARVSWLIEHMEQTEQID